MINYSGKFSQVTVEVCKPHRKLTSLKSKWTYNSTYQHLYDIAKAIIKNNATTVFYNKKEQLYLEGDVSGVGL